eukprot:5556720-Karenia_brevis.AAC.1
MKTDCSDEGGGAMKPRVLAKKSLEEYCFTMWNTLLDEQLQDNFNSSEKAKFVNAVKNTFDWLDKNQLAEEYECERMHDDLEKI